MAILDKIHDFPIKPHHTWNIVDSTKMQEFMNCRRKFFFKYVLGWRREGSNVHLAFGSAWHKAHEVLAAEGYSSGAIVNAHKAFLEEYRKSFDEVMDDVNAPKEPGNALQALVEYTKQYHDDFQHFEPMMLEIAGTVPIGTTERTAGRVLHFKMDSINKRLSTDQFFSHEHKTSGQDSARFTDQWSLKFQIGTYSHALYCMYDPNEVEGVIINGSIIRKKGNKHIRIPARWNLNRMKKWLWQANHYYDLMEWDYAELSKSSRDEDVLAAFPENPEACFKYGKCPFYDFCRSTTNPLQITEEGEPPSDEWDQEYWDPSAEELEANYKAELSLDRKESKVTKIKEKRKEERPEEPKKPQSKLQRSMFTPKGDNDE